MLCIHKQLLWGLHMKADFCFFPSTRMHLLHYCQSCQSHFVPLPLAHTVIFKQSRAPFADQCGSCLAVLWYMLELILEYCHYQRKWLYSHYMHLHYGSLYVHIACLCIVFIIICWEQYICFCWVCIWPEFCLCVCVCVCRFSGHLH